MESILVERWPFWAGGAAIGLFVVIFLLVSGRRLGVSTGLEDVCAAVTDPKIWRSWRLRFLVGLVLGGAASAALAGAPMGTTSMGAFDVVVSGSLPVKLAVFSFGGVLVGFGSRLAGGCTSGHGIVGVAQLAPSSLLATGAFMVAGAATTNALFAALGG